MTAIRSRSTPTVISAFGSSGSTHRKCRCRSRVAHASSRSPTRGGRSSSITRSPESLPKFDPPLSAGLRSHLASTLQAGRGRQPCAARVGGGESARERDQGRHRQPRADRRDLPLLLRLCARGDGRQRTPSRVREPGSTERDQPGPRPKSYNERLLALGVVTPYFIWPNVDPYRRQTSLVDAVPSPGGITPNGHHERAARSLEEARRVVREAREARTRRQRPRPVLSASTLRASLHLAAQATGSLGDRPLRRRRSTLPPDRYYTIRNPEDRLFIPAEYVPLFEARGWRRNGA